MFRFRCSLFIVCLTLMTAGCQSRCNNPCGGWFAGNSRVAPPPTYTLNIPSVANNNQPYYTPSAAAPNNYTLNPNQSAPTPANQQNQNGWRQTGNQQNNGAGASPGERRSVLTTPTTFVETRPNINQAGFPGNQRAPRTAALPGSGYSYTDSANYRTTQVDESRDATRLPVTDASTVRAPARFFPTGNVAQFQQPNQIYPANYSVPNQRTFVAQNGFNQQPAAYSGPTVLVGGQPTAYRGQAVLVNPAGYINPYQPRFAPSVLAQSTTSSDQGSAGQVGWRTRELNSDNVNRF
jgi:hypothetical protein